MSHLLGILTSACAEKIRLFSSSVCTFALLFALSFCFCLRWFAHFGSLSVLVSAFLSVHCGFLSALICAFNFVSLPCISLLIFSSELVSKLRFVYLLWL